MKKILASILALCFMVTLCACGGDTCVLQGAHIRAGACVRGAFRAVHNLFQGYLG